MFCKNESFWQRFTCNWKLWNVRKTAYLLDSNKISNIQVPVVVETETMVETLVETLVETKIMVEIVAEIAKSTAKKVHAQLAMEEEP